MLQHQFGGRADVDLAGRDAERPHQRVRILERLPAGGESRQRVAEDVGARQAEPVEGAHGDQRGLRRVESARDADDDALQSRWPRAACAAPRPGCRRPRRSVRRGAPGRLARTETARCGVRAARGPPARRVRTRCVGSRRAAPWCACTQSPKLVQPHALLAQVVQVEVRRDEAALQREAHRLGQPLAVLVDERVAVPGQVGRRFAGTRGRVEVAGDALRRLRRAEQPAVIGLADRDVARRQVGDHRRPGQRGVACSAAAAPRRPRRSRGPARSPARSSPRTAGAVPKGIVWPEQPDRRGKRLCRRRELPLLVELAVVRQVGLGHGAQQFARGAAARAQLNSRSSTRSGMPTAKVMASSLAGLDQRAQGLQRARRAGRPAGTGPRSSRRRGRARETPPGPPDSTPHHVRYAAFRRRSQPARPLRRAAWRPPPARSRDGKSNGTAVPRGAAREAGGFPGSGACRGLFRSGGKCRLPMPGRASAILRPGSQRTGCPAWLVFRSSPQGTVVAYLLFRPCQGHVCRGASLSPPTKAAKPVAKKATQSFHAVSIQPGSRMLPRGAGAAGPALPVARRPDPAAQELHVRELHVPVPAPRRPSCRTAARARHGRGDRRLDRCRQACRCRPRSPQVRQDRLTVRVAAQPRLDATTASPTNGFVAPFVPERRHRPVPGHEAHVVAERKQPARESSGSACRSRRPENRCGRSTRRTARRRRTRCWSAARVEHHVARRVARAMLHVELDVADLHLVALVEPLVGHEAFALPEAEHAALLGDAVDPELVAADAGRRSAGSGRARAWPCRRRGRCGRASAGSS